MYSILTTEVDKLGASLISIGEIPNTDTSKHDHFVWK